MLGVFLSVIQNCLLFRKCFGPCCLLVRKCLGSYCLLFRTVCHLENVLSHIVCYKKKMESYCLLFRIVCCLENVLGHNYCLFFVVVFVFCFFLFVFYCLLFTCFWPHSYLGNNLITISPRPANEGLTCVHLCCMR